MGTRKIELLDIGARLAAKHGLKNVTRRMVATEANVSDALVSSYLGNVEEQRAAYKKRAKALKLTLPDAKAEALMGRKLRAHGPRDARDTRKRSAREVEAIKRKAPVARPSKTPVFKPTKVNAVPVALADVVARKPTAEKIPLARSAARPPKSEPMNGATNE